MSEVKRYPHSVLKLQFFEGFNEHFEGLLVEYPATKAYELTEDLFYHYFARTRYSGYESFRKVREGRLKKWK